MNRRGLLASVGVAGAVGSAGCVGLLNRDGNSDTDGGGDGGGGCSSPSTDDLVSLLPGSGGGYNRQRTQELDPGRLTPSPRKLVFAPYNDPSDTSFSTGGDYYVTVGLFESEGDAETALENWSPDDGSHEVVGYLVVGEYGFFGGGKDREGTGELLARSPALDEGCVDERLTFY